MTARVTNQGPNENLYRFDSLNPAVMTTDDEKIEGTGQMFHATANRTAELNLDKGAGGRFRMCFQVPKDAKPKMLVLRQTEDARAYVIDLSGVQ